MKLSIFILFLFTKLVASSNEDINFLFGNPESPPALEHIITLNHNRIIRKDDSFHLLGLPCYVNISLAAKEMFTLLKLEEKIFLDCTFIADEGAQTYQTILPNFFYTELNNKTNSNFVKIIGPRYDIAKDCYISELPLNNIKISDGFEHLTAHSLCCYLRITVDTDHTFTFTSNHIPLSNNIKGIFYTISLSQQVCCGLRPSFFKKACVRKAYNLSEHVIQTIFTVTVSPQNKS